MATSTKAQIAKIDDEHLRLSIQHRYGDISSAALTTEEALDLWLNLAQLLPVREIHDFAVEWTCQ